MLCACHVTLCHEVNETGHVPVTLQAHDLSTDDHPLVKIVGIKMPKEDVTSIL